MRLRKKTLLLYCSAIVFVLFFQHAFLGILSSLFIENSQQMSQHFSISQNHLGKTNIVYIKMLKCASETLSGIFRRFGYHHNLTYVLPRGRDIYLGWPYQLEEQYFRKTTTGKYNILCEHSVYNATTFKSLMPKNTVYITSLREPLQQLKSLFNYYNIANLSGLPKDDPKSIIKYYTDLKHYEDIYKSHDSAKRRYCIPDGFSMTKNPMAFNLGFPTGSFDGSEDLSDNKTVITKWLKAIAHDFDMVLIVEYFVESLVLLRRLLHWTWWDIIYVQVNLGQYNKDALDPPLERHLRHIHRKRGNIDYQLYDYFKRLLIKKIRLQKHGFNHEVNAFNKTVINLAKFCNGNKTSTDVNVPETRWSPGFVFTRDDCSGLMLKYLVLLQKEADNSHVYLSSNDKQIKSLPTYKCLC